MHGVVREYIAGMVVVAGHGQAIEATSLKAIQDNFGPLIDQVCREQKRRCLHPILLY